ncbi:uncharacterized protein SEPMUDRAFT_146067 [Sphaerulina musiva SO2202]|uniref:Uncharacterized protein n=1 Tax=Sphaerulina musiva (strain SO2202) TaxID=692275 RepID=N1QI65_SPHMS|nr:uncharacterized protein SEPMUDRAFT_146067 [Sphaerulina musiva SO2202]EMF16941.1 hypothetical protein SEPMUDRAFT_146067 [Sphaerulina musiva SO2202]
MPKVYRRTLQTYIDRCAADGAFEQRTYCPSSSQNSAQASLLRDDNANMRNAMLEVITTLPAEPPARDLPDMSRLKIRSHDDDRRPRMRSRSRRRSRSRSRRRHRDDDSYHRSARSTPMHTPRKDVRFFDESPPPRSRKAVVPDRPKSYARDAPPIALGESAKDTARRLYTDHRRHYREDSASSASLAGSRGGSRVTSGANSPVSARRPDPVERLKTRRPGVDRVYSADTVRRGDLAATSNVADAGSAMLLPMDLRPSMGHRRWHSRS